jgi:DNA primase
MSLGNVDLSRELVQAVREAADIVSVAGDHTRLTRKGRDWQGLCPLHKEKTPSFHVDPERGLFYCFGCGSGGDAIKLHMLLTGDDFPAAIEALALRHGVPMRPRAKRRRHDEPDVDGALAAAAEWYVARLAEAPAPRRYLAERQVPAELVEGFAIGYAPDGWTGLYDALKGRVAERDLEAAGLVARSRRGTFIDRFRHRLMFPVHNPAGRLVGFGGRTLGDDDAKYVNTAETERFHKGDLLYGLFQSRRAIRDGGRAVLVEGYFDVLGAAASGVEGAVATMGTALTPEQARLLARYAEEVVVAYDGDDAGERAHRRALPILLDAGLAVHRAVFPAGHDPDSLRLEAGPEVVARAMREAPDAVLREVERMTPEGAHREPRAQAKAASDLAELLGRLSDPVLRYSYGRRAAERLDLPVEVLLERVPGAAARAAGKGGGAAVVPAASVPTEAAAAAARSRGSSPVRSLEEQTLELLLVGETLQAPRKLPPADVFLDPACRNIYRAFRTLYGEEGGGRAPDPRAVLAELGDDGATVDRLARLLVGSGTVPPGSRLPHCLDQLTRRWFQQRLRALAREIAEAQRQGDTARLDRLLTEKTALSYRLHRGTAPDASRTREETQ